MLCTNDTFSLVMPPLSKMVADELITTAHNLADAARGITLKYFRSAHLHAENKKAASFDPVTQADREAENEIRKILSKQRPNDTIIGEEFAQTIGKSGISWIIDPIDGTRAFLSGSPTWGVLIAVSNGKEPVYGIIDQPYIGERFEGGFGLAHYNGPLGKHPLATRSYRPIEQSILFSTFPEIGTSNEQMSFQRVSQKVRLTRYGLDCYAYCLLAAGHIDLVIEAGLQPYDIAAPIAVVKAAGGIVSNWSGDDCQAGGQIIAAANPEIHAEALALLNKA